MNDITNTKYRETKGKINRALFISIIVLSISLFVSLADVNALIIGGTEKGYFNGSIDEVRIWNRVLSSTEIQQHYYSNLYMYDLNIWNFYTNQINLRDGIYTYYGYANAISGNENFTEERTITVDTTSPTSSNLGNNASSATKINGVVNWSINLLDNIELNGYIFAHNNSGTLTNGSFKALNGNNDFVNDLVTITQIRDNYICGQFWVNDSANNIHQTTLSCFTVINTAPTVPFVTYPQNGKNYSDTELNINFSSTDVDGDSITYDIYINGSLNMTTTTNVTDWNASDGYYNLTVTASDGINYSSNSSVIHFRLDSILPSFSNEETNASLMKIYGNATFNITVTDNIGLDYYIFSWNGTGRWDNLTSGIISGNNVKLIISKSTNLSQSNVIGYKWYAKDSAGNWNMSLLRTFAVVNTEIIFNGTIGNQVWNEDTNLTDIITLNNYFLDVDNDVLIYNVTGNSSIKVIINQTTSNVTLAPIKDWHGTEIIYFTATDGKYVVNSNNITLTVINVPDCGDNIKETGEECDGTDLAGQSCISKVYSGGTLGCTSSCTFDTSNCYYYRPSSPPLSLVPSQGTLAPTGSRGTLACARINYTETNQTVTLERSLIVNETIPLGYEVIMEPFNLQCDGEIIDFTISIPENYVNVTLLKCVEGVCSPTTITQTTKLQCLDLISRELKRETTDLTPELMGLDIKPKKLDITEVKKVIQSGNNSIKFYGGAFKNLTVDIKKSDKPIEEAKNPYLRIVGTPLVINFNRKESLGSIIKLPYTEEENIESDSLGIYARIKNEWDYIGGSINNTERVITADVSNISVYLDENSTAIFAIMGIICEYCYNSSLEKIYNGSSRDAIILVHGLASSPNTFNEIIGDIELTNQPFQTWTFGYSSQRKIDEISKEFMDLLESHSNEFDRVYIVAHSLGGLIVQKALYDSYNLDYAYINKVRKIVLVGVPNEGSVFIGVYGKLYRKLINKASKYRNIFNINSELVDTLQHGFITPRVPGIEYYVIAGTNPYELGIISELKFIDEQHDGIVTTKSAQRIGEGYVNDTYNNYWDIYVTHTELIDNDAARKLIERVIAKDIVGETGFENAIGYTNYFELKIASCDSNDKYIVIGKRIPLRLCGNGICEAGEDELNCAIDCAERLAWKGMKWLWLTILITVTITIIGYFGYRKYKAAPLKTKLIRFENLYKKENKLIRKNKARKSIQKYMELKNEYNELVRLPLDIGEKYKIYFEANEGFERIKEKLKNPEFRFYRLIIEIEAKIRVGRIKEAIRDYIELKKIYDVLIKKSNFIKKRRLHNEVLGIYRKLVSVKEKTA